MSATGGMSCSLKLIAIRNGKGEMDSNGIDNILVSTARAAKAACF